MGAVLYVDFHQENVERDKFPPRPYLCWVCEIAVKGSLVQRLIVSSNLRD
jgi:hypothetical protein